MTTTEKERDDLEEGLTRHDFLKAMGLGLGAAAGLGSMLGGSPAFAEGEKKGKYIVVITHGGNNPNRAVLALILADVAAAKGWGSVHVWMTLEGADLANGKKADRIDSPIFKKFGNALELMNKIKGKGGWFGVCPPCADYFTGDDKLDFVEKAGGDWLMKNMQDAWVVWM
jgi:predicted peroxiredoxin